LSNIDSVEAWIFFDFDRNFLQLREYKKLVSNRILPKNEWSANNRKNYDGLKTNLREVVVQHILTILSKSYSFIAHGTN